ncbi:Inner nuclear membrane protein Man1 [Frankliniella fusca]|uniref:Inner nuclear membrane protein Man1 n=1 Tax=Frankliniella fusca TaxID=407009 RepID=A0AAE1HVT7_9NEOP|nr:Inner nuclear membrane protein Man1 [Frankliniella fusca]
MASVEALSDSDLRKKLIEHGFDAPPVTGTTRKLMEKKLTALMSQQGKPSKAPAPSPKVNRALSRFSSAEEDSDDALSSSRRKSMPAPNVVKRKSMGRSARAAEAAAREAQVVDNLLMPSPPPPAQPQPLPARGRYSMNEAAMRKNALPLSAPTPPRATRKSMATSSPLKPSLRHSVGNGFDSGSDSDVPMPSISSVRLSPSPSKSPLRDEGQDDEEEEDEDDKPIATLLSNLSDRFLPKSGTGRLSSPEASNVKHRMNIGKDSNPDVTDAPYLSAFARRLSQLKAQPIGSPFNGNSYDNVKESDASSDDSVSASAPPNGHYYRRSLAGPARVPMRRIDPSRSFKTSEETLSFWNNSHVMSSVIIGCFVLCAIVLITLYVNVATKETSNLLEESSVGNVYNICKESPGDDVPGVTCVTKDGVAPAMKIFDSVFIDLMGQAVKSECGPTLPDGSYPAPYLTERETVQAVVERQGLSIWEAEEQVANLIVLLSSNSHWGVSVLDNVVRHPDKTKLQVSSPKIPWKCIVMNKLFSFLTSGLFIICGFGLLFGVWRGVQWWMSSRRKQQQEVYHYVERIIEYLSSQHQSTGESAYVPVIHVRDQLIPPQSREKLRHVWDAAVAFIDKKESRVREEIQPVNGEDYKVWRWLPPKLNSSVASSTAESPTSSPQPRHRQVWQGKAFGLSDKSVNSLANPPTPCLKIRHMFDPDMESGENWQLQVQDAILEKCLHAKILHIHVDKSSKEGLVYVKCASDEDAGKAYKALHGSWFDSQLVTVKYLRLERYHERFPNAAKAKDPMRPSNNLRLSLQATDDD